MDYLYINAIVKETYRDLPCGCPFPDSYKDPVLKASAGDAFLKEPSISSVISFYSIKARNRLPVLVLSNVEKHTNTASVGRFTQCMGWEWDGRLALSDLDSVFQAAFYTEQEINDMALRQVTIPLPRSARRELAPVQPSITPAAKQAVLTAVILRWLRHLPAVRIAVPKNVDYNQYVLNAVKELYSMFPVALRAEAGFCSFLPSLKDTNSRIYIGFIPESMADSATIFLDGSSRAAISNICTDGTGRVALDQFIKYLSSASPEQRQGFLTELFGDVEHSCDSTVINELTPRDYVPTGECLMLLSMDGSMDQMLPKWKSFCGNLDKYPVHMRRRVQEKIRNSLIPGEACQLFRSKLAAATDTEAVLSELGSYAPLCGCTQDLADPLWTAAVDHLRGLGVSFLDIRKAVVARKEALSPLVDDAKTNHLLVLSVSEQLDIVKNLPAETLPEVERALKHTSELRTLIQNVPPSDAAQSLKESIQELYNRLVSIRNQLTLSELNKRYQEILQLPSKTLAEIMELLQQARQFQTSMESLQMVPGVPELSANLQTLISEKQAAMDSSDVRFRQLIQKLSANVTYFEMLDIINEDRDIELNSIQREQLNQLLAERKPTSITAYEDAFYTQYRRKLTLSAVSKFPDYVCSSIVRDICLFNQVIVSPRKDSRGGNESPAQFSERITGHRYIAQQISETCSVDVLFNSNVRDGKWFQKLLTLSHDKNSMGNRSDFETDFFALVDYGFFSGRDMCACVEMLHNCSMKITPLFQRILLGKFRDCEPGQYMDAFRLIDKCSSNKRILTEMQRIADGLSDKDPSAVKAFHNFIKKNQSGSKKKWIILIAGGVLLLIIAAVVLLLVFGSFGKPQPTEAPTKPTIRQTEPTEPPKVQYPPVFHKFAEGQPVLNRLFPDAQVRDFSVLKDAVSQLLTQADEETKQKIVEYYVEGASDPESHDLDWNAYFFWKCWILGNTENVNLSEAFADVKTDLSAADNEAAAITRFLQAMIPVAPQPSEPAADTEAENQQQSQEAAQTAADTANAATDPNAETTVSPPPTIEEILTACSDAAITPYEEASSSMDDLLQIVELFGAGLDKPFTEQQSRLDRLFASSEANVNQLRLHYQTLPGDTLIRFADGEIAVTWNEYVFWEFWLLAKEDAVVITSDSFNDALSTQVLSILRVLYTLPDVALPSPAQESQFESQSELSAGTAAATQDTDLGFTAVYEAAQPGFDQAESVYRTVVAQILAD